MIERREKTRFVLEEDDALIDSIAIEGPENGQFALEVDVDHIATLVGSVLARKVVVSE